MGEGESVTWRRHARRLALRLNLGLWLERVLPFWIGLALLCGVAILWQRGRGEGALLPILAFLLLLVLSGLLQIARSFPTFYRRHEGLVFLEEKLHLHNRLSSADAGVGPWPAVPFPFPRVARLRFERALVPLVVSLALVGLAARVPVAVEPEPSATPLSKPLAWQEMETSIEKLRQEEAVTEEAIDAFEERLQVLESQPKEDWFRHGSLEASDSLEEELRSEMRSLVGGLEQVESSIEALGALDEKAPADERRLRQRGLRAALDDLELGALPLDRELTRELHVLAREGKLRRATKEEIAKWKELRERLYHGLPGGKDGVAVAMGVGTGDVTGSSGSGRGGVTRGPGSAPIQLADERTELGSTAIETVRSEDVSRGLFGETLGFSLGEHDVDSSSYRGGYDAGTVASRGEGGDVVWRQSLTPRERRVLAKYFQ
jgi:hypothetical protein